MAVETVNVYSGNDGTVIGVAADSSSEGFVQIFKLGYSADGSSTPVTADASGLSVQLTASDLYGLPGDNAATVGGSVTVLTGLKALVEQGSSDLDGVTLDHVPFYITASGSTVVSAQGAGTATRVVGGFITQVAGSSSNVITVRDGASGGTLAYLAPGQGLKLEPWDEGHWDDSTANTAIVFDQSSAGTVCGVLTIAPIA